VGMSPQAVTLLAEIRRLIDAAGRVTELPLLDVTDGSIEKLKDLLEELDRAGYVEREASDTVLITARGLAAKVDPAP
jgi:hypothetical protein